MKKGYIFHNRINKQVFKPTKKILNPIPLLIYLSTMKKKEKFKIIVTTEMTSQRYKI